MGRQRSTTPVSLNCEECGTKQMIHRLTSHLYSKKGGHKKKLWCYVCKKEVNHVEQPLAYA